MQHSTEAQPAGSHSPVSHRPDLILALILALLPGLFFWRLLTPNPADRMHIAGGDFTEQYFPLRAFVAQEWVQGRLPLWNPYLYGGQPALADIQSGALYPPHIIEALILGWGGPLFGREIGFPLPALEWQVIAHFSLAAVGMYLFARHLACRSPIPIRRARFGSIIASLVFTYSGYLTGFPVQQITILEVSAWLPWILWSLSTTLDHITPTKRQEPASEPSSSQPTIDTKHPTPISHPKSPIPTALIFALAILAGHPQTLLYLVYLTLAYAAFRAIEAWPQMPSQTGSAPVPWRPRLRILASHLGLWLIAVLLGAMIAAAQLLPTLEFIGRSLRSSLTYRDVSAGLPLNEFISILYPGFFGGSPEYVGLASLVLMALALVLAQPRREIFFWAGAGLLSFLLAFGGNTFLYPLFYLFAPGFEAVRQQERAFLIYSFSAAILAGYGALVLAGPLSKAARSTYHVFERRLQAILGVALGLTGFFIYGSAAASARGDEANLFFGALWHHLFGLLILGGLLALLALRPRRWLRRTWGMALLAGWLAFNLFSVNWRFNLEPPVEPGPFTANGVTQFLQEALQVQNQESLASGRIVSGGLLPGGNSAASVYGLQDLTGNTPLQLARVAAFLEQMPAWRLWQLMNIRYIVAERDIGDAGLTLAFAEGDLNVFEMGDPFPRGWFVSETELVPDDAQAIARLAAADFDLRTTAVVAKGVATPLTDISAATASLVYFSPSQIIVTVEAAGHHLLVLSQIYDPGWQVEIDNVAVPLLRVNVVQQGVVVPPGRHTVELTYRPHSFWLGSLLSLAGLAVCLIVIGWNRVLRSFKKVSSQ